MLIKQNKNLVVLLLLFIFVLGCKKKEQVKEIIVAEVGNTKLTEAKLNSYLGEKNNSVEFRDEFIRQWVETEALYQIAKEKNILNNNNFENTIEQSKKKLAASLVIDDFLKKNNPKLNNRQLLNFYKKNKNNFLLPTDAYVLNYISFLTEEEAINFRNKAINKGWSKAENEIVNKNNIVENYQDKLIKITQIPSKKILRLLKVQYKNEISLVIKTELNNFVVVQQKAKIKKNNVPKFKYIKNEVQALYTATKNKELVHTYINKLISEKQVKIY